MRRVAWIQRVVFKKWRENVEIQKLIIVKVTKLIRIALMQQQLALFGEIFVPKSLGNPSLIKESKQVTVT